MDVPIARVVLAFTALCNSKRSVLLANRTACGFLGFLPPKREMNWAILILAGLFEIGWAIGLKYTQAFTRLWLTVGTVLAMIVSLGLLGVAMKGLPVGTAYSVWVGVGAVGTVILGIVLLGEPATLPRIISIALILAGIVGLKLSN